MNKNDEIKNNLEKVITKRLQDATSFSVDTEEIGAIAKLVDAYVNLCRLDKKLINPVTSQVLDRAKL